MKKRPVGRPPKPTRVDLARAALENAANQGDEDDIVAAKEALENAEAEANTSFTKEQHAASRALETLRTTKVKAQHIRDRAKERKADIVRALPAVFDPKSFTEKKGCIAPTLHAVGLCDCQAETIPRTSFAEVREMANAQLATRYLKHFVKQAWPFLYPTTPLEWGRHIEVICNHVQNQLMDRWQAQKSGENLRAQNLLINIPPRSLKTTVLSLATVWAWLHEPVMKIMYLSSNPRVSVMSARWAQAIVRSKWFTDLVGGAWLLKLDHDALTSYGNNMGGTRVARSLQGAVTGEGADWLIIDDPHDVRDSEMEIANTVDGYDAAVHNRINDPKTSVRTAIMQRFRVDDFSGHVLDIHGGDPGKGGWLHVRMPTEYIIQPSCTCGSCIGKNVYNWEDWRKEEGEVIHPRFSPEFIAEEKRTKGPYGYAGQHQQEPAPPAGGMLKNTWYGWFRLPENPPMPHWKRPSGCNEDPTVVLERKKNGKLDLDMIVISVDGTFGNIKESSGSAVGLQVYGLQRMRKFLLDDKTDAIPYLDALERIRGMVRQWAHEAPVRVLIEPKAFGPMAVEELRRDLREGKLVDCNGRSVVVVVEVLKGPDDKGMAGDKITRAHAATPALAAGLVLLREGAQWTHAHVQETGVFPNGKRDDRVDAMTQVINFYGETNDIAKARALLRR